MIRDIQGDLFFHMGDYEAIAHGCNCRGLMGAGIAREVRRRWPHGMYRWYTCECTADNFMPGDIMPWFAPGLPILFNLATQDRPGAAAKTPWISQCFERLFLLMDCMDIATIAIPRIGCGIGGLNWENVKEAINCPSEFQVDAYYL